MLPAIWLKVAERSPNSSRERTSTRALRSPSRIRCAAAARALIGLNAAARQHSHRSQPHVRMAEKLIHTKAPVQISSFAQTHQLPSQRIFGSDERPPEPPGNEPPERGRM